MRNKEATKARIVEAFGRVLETKGVQGFSLNAVVREAKIGKDLLYGYFGGIRGLAHVWAQNAELWPSWEQLVPCDPAEFLKQPAKIRFKQLALGLLRTLPNYPLAVAVLQAELYDPSDLVKGLTDAGRSKVLGPDKALTEELRDQMGNRIDVDAFETLLVGAMVFLAVRSKKATDLARLGPLNTEAWNRLESTTGTVIDRMFSNAETSPRAS